MSVRFPFALLAHLVSRRIQEEGLRTYLYTYAPHYSTLSLALLSKIFALPVRNVTSIVSKMIWGEELAASVDQTAGVVVFHRLELSRTQQLAQTLAEKVAGMLEQNEKALDARMGNTPGWGGREDGAKGGEQTQERRGRREGGRGGLRGESRSCFEEVRWVLIDDCRRGARGSGREVCARSGECTAVDSGVCMMRCILYAAMTFHYLLDVFH